MLKNGSDCAMSKFLCFWTLPMYHSTIIPRQTFME